MISLHCKMSSMSSLASHPHGSHHPHNHHRIQHNHPPHTTHTRQSHSLHQLHITHHQDPQLHESHTLTPPPTASHSSHTHTPLVDIGSGQLTIAVTFVYSTHRWKMASIGWTPISAAPLTLCESTASSPPMRRASSPRSKVIHGLRPLGQTTQLLLRGSPESRVTRSSMEWVLCNSTFSDCRAQRLLR